MLYHIPGYFLTAPRIRVGVLLFVEGHGADIPQYDHTVNGSRRQNRSIWYVYQLTFPFLKEAVQQTEIPVYCYVYVSTLTEVFPCFFLSCNANARVYLANTGHGPHSS
jgi:hypothetical protein